MVHSNFQPVYYLCPICKQQASWPGPPIPICRCCRRTICGVCGPQGFCPDCWNLMTPEEQNVLPRMVGYIGVGGGGNGSLGAGLYCTVLLAIIGITGLNYPTAEKSVSTIATVLGIIATGMILARLIPKKLAIAKKINEYQTYTRNVYNRIKQQSIQPATVPNANPLKKLYIEQDETYKTK